MKYNILKKIEFTLICFIFLLLCSSFNSIGYAIPHERKCLSGGNCGGGGNGGQDQIIQDRKIIEDYLAMNLNIQKMHFTWGYTHLGYMADQSLYQKLYRGTSSIFRILERPPELQFQDKPCLDPITLENTEAAALIDKNLICFNTQSLANRLTLRNFKKFVSALYSHELFHFANSKDFNYGEESLIENRNKEEMDAHFLQEFFETQNEDIPEERNTSEPARLKLQSIINDIVILNQIAENYKFRSGINKNNHLRICQKLEELYPKNAERFNDIIENLIYFQNIYNVSYFYSSNQEAQFYASILRFENLLNYCTSSKFAYNKSFENKDNLILNDLDLRFMINFDALPNGTVIWNLQKKPEKILNEIQNIIKYLKNSFDLK